MFFHKEECEVVFPLQPKTQTTVEETKTVKATCKNNKSNLSLLYSINKIQNQQRAQDPTNDIRLVLKYRIKHQMPN